MNRVGVVAVDVGSQSTRAALVDRRGRIQAIARCAAPPRIPGDPDAAESSADAFWDGVCTAVQSLLTDRATRGWHVAAVALSAQRGSTVVCDDHGVPLRPAVLWSDRRTCEALEPLPMWLRAGLRVTGATGIVRELRSRAPGNRLRAEEPDTWRRAQRVALLGSWLTFRMTGRWHDSVAAQVGFVPLNFRRLRWHRAGNWRWHALGGLVPSQLPTLAAPGEIIGELTNAAARRLGLAAGLPVVGAAADKACEVLGVGALNDRDEVLSLGTAATVVRPRSRFCHVRRFLPAYPAAVPGGFLGETQIACGFSRLTAFLASGRIDLPSRAPDFTEQALETTRPGAAGLIAALGLPAPPDQPDAWLRAALPERTPDHSPAQALRALLEGLAFELRFAHEKFARRFGPPERIVLAGGGARSPQMAQLVASVLGQPVARPDTAEATLLGAAMCAAPAAGWQPDVRTAAQSMAPEMAQVLPDRAARDRYDDLYARHYRPALEAIARTLWSAPTGRARLSP